MQSVMLREASGLCNSQHTARWLGFERVCRDRESEPCLGTQGATSRARHGRVRAHLCVVRPPLRSMSSKFSIVLKVFAFVATVVVVVVDVMDAEVVLSVPLVGSSPYPLGVSDLHFIALPSIIAGHLW